VYPASTNLSLKSLPISRPDVIEETIDVLINALLNAAAIYVKAPTDTRAPPIVRTPPTTSEIRSEN
jgi:hypothetical protein